MRKEIEERFHQLPEFVQKEFIAKFENSTAYLNFMNAIRAARSGNNYIANLELNRQLDKMREEAVAALLEKEEREVRVLKSTELGLTREQIDKVNELQIALYVLCDVMDSVLVDFKALFRIADERLSFSMFDDINALSVRLKERIEYVEKNLGLVENGDMYEHSDNLYKMTLTKARKIYNTYKERKAQCVNIINKEEDEKE